MIEHLVQDLRFAARTFRRAPGFLLLTVLTIAIGLQGRSEFKLRP